MTTVDPALRPWWGTYTLGEDETACWQIGGFRLWVQRRRREWRWAMRSVQAIQGSVELPNPSTEGFPADPAIEDRYGLYQSGERVVLEPRVADRPLVWRPPQPLAIAPGEETTLYLRSPLWLALRADGSGGVWWESPLRQLSDTWIGSPTDDGGLAYSAPREFFFSGEEVPRDTSHAITPIVVRNLADDPLHLERLNLPMTYLSLYAAIDGSVWTQRVTLEHEDEAEELALLRVGEGPPPEAGRGPLLAPPRADSETNLVFQAFKRFFGQNKQKA